MIQKGPQRYDASKIAMVVAIATIFAFSIVFGFFWLRGRVPASTVESAVPSGLSIWNEHFANNMPVRYEYCPVDRHDQMSGRPDLATTCAKEVRTFAPGECGFDAVRDLLNQPETQLVARSPTYAKGDMEPRAQYSVLRQGTGLVVQLFDGGYVFVFRDGVLLGRYNQTVDVNLVLTLAREPQPNSPDSAPRDIPRNN